MTIPSETNSQTSYPNQPVSQSNGMAVTALVLGIVAIAGCLIPLLNIFSIIIGVVGLIFGLIAYFGKNRYRRTFALIGSILSLSAIIISIVVLVNFASAVKNVADKIDKITASSVPTSAPSAQAAANTVEYQLTGTGTISTVNYGGLSGIESVKDAALPWSKTAKGDGSFAAYSLFAMGGSDTSTSLTCKILLNGKEVVSKTSTGAYAAVTCSATK